MSNDKMMQSLEALLPKCLDDIITINRDKARIQLSADEQLTPMMQPLSSNSVRETLDEWRFITLSSLVGDEFRVRLLGQISRNGMAWFTSAVVHIDLEQGLVQTHNSFYRLGTKGEGEPPFEHLACLCACLHKQGVGEVYGIPHFFY